MASGAPRLTVCPNPASRLVTRPVTGENTWATRTSLNAMRPVVTSALPTGYSPTSAVVRPVSVICCFVTHTSFAGGFATAGSAATCR